jgi:hypothetical protein
MSIKSLTLNIVNFKTAAYGSRLASFTFVKLIMASFNAFKFKVNDTQLCIYVALDKYNKKIYIFSFWSFIACSNFEFFELISKQLDPNLKC